MIFESVGVGQASSCYRRNWAMLLSQEGALRSSGTLSTLSLGGNSSYRGAIDALKASAQSGKVCMRIITKYCLAL